MIIKFVKVALLTFILLLPYVAQASESVDDLNLSDKTTQKNPFFLLRKGEGKNNVIQGIALDLMNKRLYTLNVTKKPEKGVINSFFYDSNIKVKESISSLDFQIPSDDIGHQGLSFNPVNKKLYSSSGRRNKKRGRYIFEFSYSPKLKKIHGKTIKVFDDTYNSNVSAMPTFTLDGKKLIIRGKKGRVDLIRIYDSSVLNLSYSDVTSETFVEWEISKDIVEGKRYIQSIAADNKNVFIISGDSSLNNKYLYIYDFKGNVVKKIKNITLGKKIALETGKEKHWEPEGLAYDEIKKCLLIAFAVGDKSNRKAIVFSIPRPF